MVMSKLRFYTSDMLYVLLTNPPVIGQGSAFRFFYEE